MMVFTRNLYTLVSRRAVARILSTFLCSVALAILPFSKLGGTSAFLILTLKELVFSVQEDLNLQIEATLLNVMGALFGICLSTFAQFLASVSIDNTVNERLIPAIFLVIICFFGE